MDAIANGLSNRRYHEIVDGTATKDQGTHAGRNDLMVVVRETIPSSNAEKLKVGIQNDWMEMVELLVSVPVVADLCPSPSCAGRCRRDVVEAREVVAVVEALTAHRVVPTLAQGFTRQMALLSNGAFVRVIISGLDFSRAMLGPGVTVV